MLMMMAVAALGLVVVAPPAPATTVEGLAWLQGTWAGEKDGVHSDEVWTSAGGGAILGVHRDVKAGRMVSWEFLRIQATATGVTLFASPQSAPPTPFTLVESGATRAVFENKAHDFPQRVVYRRCGPDLCARIEVTMNGRPAKQEWRYTRTK